MSSMTSDRVRDLQAAYKARIDANDTLVHNSERNEDGQGFRLTEAAKAEFQKNLGELAEIRGELELLTSHDEAVQWATKTATESIAVAGHATVEELTRRAVQAAGRKSIGQQFVESELFRKHLESTNGAGRGDMVTPVVFEGYDLGAMAGRKNVFSDSPTGTGTFGMTTDAGVFAAPWGLAGPRIRDLLNVQPTESNLIEFIRTTGWTNGASMVAEQSGGSFVSAPQTTLSFYGDSASVRMISHYELAHLNALADENQLRSIIDGALLAGLRLREDAQLLYGDGAGQNLKGIISGGWSIQTYTGLSSDTYADQLRRAITKAWIAEYPTTGIVVNPYDWESLELLKDSENRYIIATSVQAGGVPRVWQVPVVVSPAITQGTALLGGFGLGAQMWDRMQPEIRTSESHANLFIQHGVAIMATERVALTVPRPEAFVKVTFT